MKPSIPTLTVAVLVAVSGAAVLAESPDEESVKKVIRAETDAYFNCDADAWAATWLHDDTATRTLVANNSYWSRRGWDNFGPEMMKSLRKSKPVPVEVQSESYIIRIDGNLACVEYAQQLKPLGSYTNVVAFSRECRVLSKQNGEWKIATQITHNPDSFTAARNIEAALNATGYQLLAQKKTKEAIDLFKLNTQFYPNSANTYDSLGEAQALDGDKTEAIKNYEKSIALNPKNENGKAALAKLKQ
jgi:tetratricopeptide (TPR) repeat protein